MRDSGHALDRVGARQRQLDSLPVGRVQHDLSLPYDPATRRLFGVPVVATVSGLQAWAMCWPPLAPHAAPDPLAARTGIIGPRSKVLRGGRDFYHGAGRIHRYTEAALDAATHGIDLEVGADGIAPACFHCSIVIEGHRVPREDQPGLGTQAWSTLYESK
jgi:hypothetical protein